MQPMDDALRRQFEKTLFSSRYAWWEWDLVTNAVTSNALKVAMLGYGPSDFEGVGYQAYTNLLHPGDHNRTRQAIRDHLEGKIDRYEIDYRLRCADGTTIWTIDRGCIISRSEEGAPRVLRGVVVDLGPELAKLARNDAIVAVIRPALPSNADKLTLCVVCTRFEVQPYAWASISEDAIASFPTKTRHTLCPDCAFRLHDTSSTGEPAHQRSQQNRRAIGGRSTGGQVPGRTDEDQGNC